MAKPSFWRDLAVEFLALQSDRKLRARSHEFMYSAFEALAKQGASEIANARDSNLFAVWFEALRRENLVFYRPSESDEGVSVETLPSGVS
jgi:hypothetical protein